MKRHQGQQQERDGCDANVHSFVFIFRMNAAGCDCSSATLPAATRGRVEHGLADFLRFVGILEGRPAILTGFKGFEEICHLMHERMFVSDAQSRYPPLIHVRLFAIGDMDLFDSMGSQYVARVAGALDKASFVIVDGNIPLTSLAAICSSAAKQSLPGTA